jgi:signal transduction histidine kinase
MSDLARRTYRWALVGAAVVLGAIATQSLAQVIRRQARLRAQMSAPVEALLLRFAAQGQRAAEARTPAVAVAWLAERLPSGRAAAFDLGGGLMAGDSVLPPPSVADVVRLRDGGALTLGPTQGPAPLLVGYVLIEGGRAPYILAGGTTAEGLREDLREQRNLLVAQGVALALLLLASALAFLPFRETRAPHVPIGALEEALTRLRQQGEAQSSAHEAERHRWESILRDREAMARAGELTAGIVHEVRNGLGTITGYAQLIERSGVEPDTRASAASIRSECETLEGVIRRFMELIREEEIRAAPFDLERLLLRVAGREGQRHPDVVIEVECASEDCGASGDEEILERAFENLIRNALEAAGAGGHVWITSARDTQGQWQVTIADDGPGMPAEQRNDVRPFRSTKSQGLGLGLPIAIKLVQLHDGRVVLSSRAGGGTVCAVYLPVDRGTAV